ncbi:hypothetical protein C8034_v005560 [Colletotrichum sidae]|uniref:Uncharacterized protein n=1 Tax=Colletotrichum sidae TaxID=1347389 RepID=A0A4R8T7E0_9PEZI|nr:hypothetical protein C8034_v005560 [Colletotrichum sidae]
MDHNKPNSNQLGARTNRRASAQLTIDQEGRTPLFSKPSRESLGARDAVQPPSTTNKYGFSPTNPRPPSRAGGINRSPSSVSPRPPSRAAIPRPSSSLSQTPSIASNHSVEIGSPGSRIPRPKSTIGIFSKGDVPSVATAWKLAEADEERSANPVDRTRRSSYAPMDASPSPAPRPYLSRRALDESRVRNTLGKDAVDYSRPRPQSRLSSDSLRDNYVARYGGSPASQQSSSSSGSFTRRLKQYERDMDQSPSATRQPENLFGRSRIGPKIAQTGQTLARKTSNGSLNSGQSLGRKASNSSLDGAQGLARKTSHGSLSGSPRPPAFASGQVPPGWIKHLLEQDEQGIKRTSIAGPDGNGAADTPLPSIEAGQTPLEPTPPTSRPGSIHPETRSPEKSYAWQLDADFTGMDLQVSDSPRIRTGGAALDDISNRQAPASGAFGAEHGTDDDDDLESRSPFKRGPSLRRSGSRNDKIDEIRHRERLAEEQRLNDLRRSQSMSKNNNKLEEIREREAQAEKKRSELLKAEERSYYPTPDDLPIRDDEPETEIAHEQPRPKNAKLDEIRAREAELLSRKARASGRLEEIREQNSMSRDLSPEPPQEEEIPREATHVKHAARTPPQDADQQGERIENTPVTIYHGLAASDHATPQPEIGIDEKGLGSSPKSPARPAVTHKRTDSRDLLQRLARAASNSPKPSEQDPKPSDQAPVLPSEQPPIEVKQAVKAEEHVLENSRKSLEDRFREHSRERLARRQAERSAESTEKKPKEETEKPRVDAVVSNVKRVDESTNPRPDVPVSAEKKAEELVTEPAPVISIQQKLQGAKQVEELKSSPEDEPMRSHDEREKETTESTRRTYTSRRRSEGRPKTSDGEPKADVPRLGRREELKTLNNAPTSKDSLSGSNDEPKALDSDRPKSAGLRRNHRQRSVDSAKNSRKSMALSDGDPTDRIEQEMNLFAPADNQSERGSTRPPSAAPSTDDDDKNFLADETPRPLKVDPLSLPTPKVTGAYIETPATARAEKPQVTEETKPVAKQESRPLSSQSRSSSSRRSSRASSRTRSISKASESGSEETGDRKEKAKTSLGTITTSILRRRKSIPRARRPLINSVKPPTVKDDLRELQRIHQIEDSTLDDFEDLLNLQNMRDAPSPELESMLEEISAKKEEVAAKPDDSKTQEDREIEKHYEKMSKQLQHGLLNIRTAKQGIERLEDQVYHEQKYTGRNPSDVKTTGAMDTLTEKSPIASQLDHDHIDHDRNCPQCVGRSSSKKAVRLNYLHLPVPSLFQREPFRLTFLGIVLLLASVWYGAESVMCELYCRPTVCSTTPCVWSSTDPTWGTALPVKLDEWTTNGWGRQVAAQLSEEASDLWADAQDFMSGIDINDIDINTLDFYGKRQLRRRLRKKGLAKQAAESAEDKVKWDAWHKARVASQRVRDAKDMGYDISEEGDSMGGDETV